MLPLSFLPSSSFSFTMKGMKAAAAVAWTHRRSQGTSTVFKKERERAGNKRERKAMTLVDRRVERGRLLCTRSNPLLNTRETQTWNRLYETRPRRREKRRRTERETKRGKRAGKGEADRSNMTPRLMICRTRERESKGKDATSFLSLACQSACVERMNHQRLEQGVPLSLSGAVIRDDHQTIPPFSALHYTSVPLSLASIGGTFSAPALSNDSLFLSLSLSPLPRNITCPARTHELNIRTQNHKRSRRQRHCITKRVHSGERKAGRHSSLCVCM